MRVVLHSILWTCLTTLGFLWLIHFATDRTGTAIFSSAGKYTFHDHDRSILDRCYLNRTGLTSTERQRQYKQFYLNSDVVEILKLGLFFSCMILKAVDANDYHVVVRTVGNRRIQLHGMPRKNTTIR